VGLGSPSYLDKLELHSKTNFGSQKGGNKMIVIITAIFTMAIFLALLKKPLIFSENLS